MRSNWVSNGERLSRCPVGGTWSLPLRFHEKVAFTVIDLSCC